MGDKRRHRQALVLLWLVLGLWLSAVHGADRGLERIPITDRTGQQVGLYTGSYALVIGVSDYSEGWPDLPGVMRDMPLVQKALIAQGFAVTVLPNPTRRELDEALNRFIYQYGQQPDHRVLIYFAGHGYTAPLAYEGDMGYIVPRDAPLPSRDEMGFRASAMDMQQIEVYARRIQAKHALFLFDSCFSGSIFALSRAIPAHISGKTAQPVWQFITSGSKDQQVPDESIFRQQFVAALEGAADVDGDGYVTGTELGEYLYKQVLHYSSNAQRPQYGKLRDARLDRGDFVFPVAAARPSRSTSTGPAVPPVGSDPAAEMWAVVKNSGYAEDLEEFLRAFPDSVYAPEARVRLRHVQRRQAEASQPPETQVAVYIPEWPKTLRNSLGMEFVLIPAGTFQMGSSKGDDDERPVHTVTLSRPFYLGTTEVTQGQWAAVMGSNPSQYKGRDHPVEQVSWEEVQRFIKQLNAKEGSSLYRLPTEAEWEYAARAGTRSAWSFGDEERSLGTYAWYGDNAGNRTHPVGQKRPNGWGLYDMHGNVREWVQDWYGPYPSGAVTDPQGPRSGSNRVIRDGSWDNSASYCRSALRSSYAPDISSVDLGFRLLRTAP